MVYVLQNNLLIKILNPKKFKSRNSKPKKFESKDLKKIRMQKFEKNSNLKIWKKFESNNLKKIRISNRNFISIPRPGKYS